jgi:hypothetical protein
MKHFTDALFEDINNNSETHQALLKAWGSSTPGNGCIFITPEGTYLNLFPKIFSHDKLCDWVDRSGYGPTTKQARWFSDNLDYVRCRNNRGLCLIELPAKITASQLDALQVWLETKVSDDTLDVGTTDGQYKSYNLQDMLPEDIIKRIKRYYSSGKLYEHKPAKSKS